MRLAAGLLASWAAAASAGAALALLLAPPATTVVVREPSTVVAIGSPAAGSCKRQRRPVVVNLDNARHQHILRHAWRAIHQGEPEVMHIARGEADENRAASLAGLDTWGDLPPSERRDIDPDHPYARHDRDEYPPASSDEGGNGGPVDSPRGRSASVRYVLSGENRSAGAVMGARLSGFCDRQAWRYERKPGPKR